MYAIATFVSYHLHPVLSCAAIKYKCFLTCNCFSFFPSFHFNVLALTYSILHFFFSLKPPTTTTTVATLPRFARLFVVFILFLVSSSPLSGSVVVCNCVCLPLLCAFAHSSSQEIAHTIYLILLCQNQRAEEHTLYFIYVFVYLVVVVFCASRTKKAHQQ